MRPPATFLVPIDFTEVTAATLATARQQARAFGARLHLLHAVDLRPLRTVSVEGLPPEDPQEEVQDELRRRLRQAADETSDRLRRDPVSPAVPYTTVTATEAATLVESSLRIGDAADEIVAAAHELGASLIVMGTHGRRGWTRWLLGSTTEAVLRRAPCPVLSVHPEPLPAEQPAVDSSVLEPLLPALRRTLKVRDCLRREAPRIGLEVGVREILGRLAAGDGLPLAVEDAHGTWVGTIYEHFLLERLLLWEGHDLSMQGVCTVERLLELQRHLHGQSAGEIMGDRQDDVVVEEGAPLTGALKEMLGRQVSTVMVTRRDRLVGVLRARDVLRTFLEFDLSTLTAPLDQGHVTELARQVLLRSADFSAAELSLTWEDDLLCVAGRAGDRASIRHAERLLRRVPGVHSLENRLVVESTPLSEP